MKTAISQDAVLLKAQEKTRRNPNAKLSATELLAMGQFMETEPVFDEKLLQAVNISVKMPGEEDLVELVDDGWGTRVRGAVIHCNGEFQITTEGELPAVLRDAGAC